MRRTGRAAVWALTIGGIACAGSGGIAFGCAGGGGNGGASGVASPGGSDRAWRLAVEPLVLPVAGRASESQLASSPRGVVLSWLEHADQAATLRFAERSNGAWSEARTVASSDDWFVSWADPPAVLRMSDGTLVAAWYPVIDLRLEAYHIRLSYSRDEGRTWAPPVSPYRDTTRTQHGFAALFERPGGGLGLVWLDGREQELKANDREGGSMALYFTSFDRAWTQGPEVLVNPRVCECCQTSVAVTADGPLVAFRDRSPREVRDVHVSRLEDGAWSPARPVHADNWEIDACPVNGPALSARDRRVAAAWFTAVGDVPRAFAAFSDDAGRTWGPPIRVDDDSSLGHVDVELLDDGAAAVSWVEFADQRAQLRVRRVEPGGSRSPAVPVTPSRVGGYPHMARHGEELVFAWTETDASGAEQTKGAVARLPRTTAP
jgi:hypothetical protein